MPAAGHSLSVAMGNSQSRSNMEDEYISCVQRGDFAGLICASSHPI